MLGKFNRHAERDAETKNADRQKRLQKVSPLAAQGPEPQISEWYVEENIRHPVGPRSHAKFEITNMVKIVERFFKGPGMKVQRHQTAVNDKE